MKIKKLLTYTGFSLIILLCLTLVTLSKINNTKSRYRSEVGKESDATAAAWDVSLTPATNEEQLNIVAGNTTADYMVKIISRSEVSCKYSIIVSNVPNDIKVSLDDKNEQFPTKNKVIFENVGSFIIGDDLNEHMHKVSFNAPIESEVNNKQIKIQAAFTQID